MIIEKTGDLLEALAQKEIDILVHNCNQHKTMGGGIALQIKRTYPEAFEADLNSCEKGEKPPLGSFSSARVGSGNIINLYAQEGVGCDDKVENRNLRYDALLDGLNTIKNNILGKIAVKKIGLVKIGIPYGIGCGLAGGKWSIVMPILESLFKDEPNITLVIYRLEGVEDID